MNLPRSSLLQNCLALLAATACGVAVAGDPAADPASLSLETLVDTEVVTAARFARQISDAPSAVSVMTAEDIRLYGFQTLGQVLDHMRGLYLTYSPGYVFLGARGYGGADLYAGRVLLIVDGVPAADSIFNQLYLGEDSLVDTELIDRIEYAPGSGSALYGRNAFVGVIHVVTRRGRDVQGVQAEAGIGQAGERRSRLTAGARLPNGAEWLASLSLGLGDGRPAPETGDLYGPGVSSRWTRWLLKGRLGDWTAQAMGVERRFEERIPEFGGQDAEANRTATLAHDGVLAPGWTSSLRLNLGRYRYRFEALPQPDVRTLYRGNWWSAEGVWTYDGLAGHRVALGAAWRSDHHQEYRSVFVFDGVVDRQRLQDRQRSAGLTVEDEIVLSPGCRGTLGLRVDLRQGGLRQRNPRAALVCELSDQWVAKASQGRASRFASRSDEGFRPPQPLPPETLSTTEAVLEYRGDGLRGAASVFRYRIDGLIYALPGEDTREGQGAELELEWQHAGWRLRGSQAWQTLHTGTGERPAFSPRMVTKLMGSAPLDGERVRLSATVRSLGSYTREDKRRTGRHSQVNAVVLWRPEGRWEWALGVRNLFDGPYEDLQGVVTAPGEDDGGARTAWMAVRGAWP